MSQYPFKVIVSTTPSNRDSEYARPYAGYSATRFQAQLSRHSLHNLQIPQGDILRASELSSENSISGQIFTTNQGLEVRNGLTLYDNDIETVKDNQATSIRVCVHRNTEFWDIKG